MCSCRTPKRARLFAKDVGPQVVTRHLPVSSGLDLNAAFSRHFLAAEPVRDATLSDASKAGEIFLGHALIFEVSGYVHGRTLAPLLLAVNRGTHGRNAA